ncbi:OmpA family protein [Ohtaekwangia sp.]|uniref:OmpA family protein n=1 Tax=Ohtaekwangia sp. TaxID=2066019 RepID=UPI002F935409
MNRVKNGIPWRASVWFMFIAITVQIITGCNATNTTKGGAIGAGAGGAIGGVIGSRSGNTAVGAIIGATVGGAAGALIGRQMDKQAEELKRDLEGARIERVGEGIKITFNSGLLFNVNSSQLNATTQDNLRQLAATLNKYEDTNILIEGHTDNTGSDTYNQKLSEERAKSVASYLSTQNVKNSRITTIGYGETQPVADNNSESGRDQNRRVEVAIYANKKMKKWAEKNEGGNS